jgi:2-dehydro-3-deoxyphosphogluconate aldolase/(4S)-4-hydroxy-2-oxoglutarate aldolase
MEDQLKMDHQQGRQELERTRVVAIIRGVAEEHILQVAEALFKGGVTVMEVTMNTPGALSMITRLQEQLGDRMYIGAGTVLDAEDARKAVEAGALFIVTPNTDEDVIRYCVDKGIPAFPGAMTPTEIVKAWKAGAAAIKIFPSGSLGIGFIKELQGPLKHIPMIAVGGVNENNIRQFFDIGCYAVGIGNYLLNQEEINKGNYEWITEKARLLLERSRAK